MRNLFMLLLFAGCAVDPNARPTQGLNNSCALYALADCIEIQTRRPISRDERLRVWAETRHSVRGTTLQDAFAAAVQFGWVSRGDYLFCVSDVGQVARGPLLADLNGHEVTLLSMREGSVLYLDPRFQAPQTIDVAALDRLTKGFYWKVMKP